MNEHTDLSQLQASMLASPHDPKIRACLKTQGDLIDSATNGASELLHHVPHNGCWWESIWVQVLQQRLYLCLGVGYSTHKLRLLIAEPD